MGGAIERVGGPRLKLSLQSYSFNKLLTRGDDGITLFDLLDFCAEQDLEAVDITSYYFPGYPAVPEQALVSELKRRACVLGLAISGTGVRTDFGCPDPERRASDVRHTKEWIEAAARLGAPVVRIFSGSEPEGYPREQVAEWMAADIRRCAEHGERFGVLVGVQNHWDFLKTAGDVLDLIARVDSQWFGVVVDTGLFLTDDPYQDIATVAPHALSWQLKEKLDGRNGSRRPDLRRLLAIIRDAGYRGYVPIETLAADGQPYDPRARVARMLGAVREAMAG